MQGSGLPTTAVKPAPCKPVWPVEAIWESVVLLLPGFTVEVLATIDSTNTELMRRARVGQLDPVLLLAERQTAGRGRMGRAWVSGGADKQEGAGAVDGVQGASCPSLTFSLGLVLRPHDWSGLSLAVGLSLAQSLHPALQIKWPNDLWWQGRKLGGILIETASMGATRYAVIGVGLNIQTPAAAPPGEAWRTPPAGLAQLLPGVQAPDVLQQVVLPLVKAVQRFESEGFAPQQAAFRSRDVLQGAAVQCSDGTLGEARGVDASGALLVHTAGGLKLVSSAEVSVRALAP